MDNRLDFIFRRRSIRRFHDKPVEQDKVTALLEAAMAAPSAANRQPWHFVVITERERLDNLAEVHPYAKMLKEATLCIAVCGEPAVSLSNQTGDRYWVQDCSAAMENMLIAAANLDLGGVWLGVHPVLDREEDIRRQLKLPENIFPLGLAALGYPAEEKKAQTRYTEAKVHYQQYGGANPSCPTD
ncbi:MAG: nitroreductase family protein [Firmicutes bacterium]|nr:nitroreductase family protein [Bacillota bacterium]